MDLTGDLDDTIPGLLQENGDILHDTEFHPHVTEPQPQDALQWVPRPASSSSEDSDEERFRQQTQQLMLLNGTNNRNNTIRNQNTQANTHPTSNSKRRRASNTTSHTTASGTQNNGDDSSDLEIVASNTRRRQPPHQPQQHRHHGQERGTSTPHNNGIPLNDSNSLALLITSDTQTQLLQQQIEQQLRNIGSSNPVNTHQNHSSTTTSTTNIDAARANTNNDDHHLDRNISSRQMGQAFVRGFQRDRELLQRDQRVNNPPRSRTTAQQIRATITTNNQTNQDALDLLWESNLDNTNLQHYPKNNSNLPSAQQQYTTPVTSPPQSGGNNNTRNSTSSFAHRSAATTARAPVPISPSSSLKGSLVQRNAEIAQQYARSQTEALNIFTLYHISPTEASKHVNTDTIAYLRFVRCPVAFPTDPTDPTNASIHMKRVFQSQQQHARRQQPNDDFMRQMFDSLQHPTNNNPLSLGSNSSPANGAFTHMLGLGRDGKPKPIHFRQQIVLSFTHLTVAKHIVQNIRNFQHPLHNLYCAHRFNTVFPVSLCGGYSIGKRETTKQLNVDNPIVIDSDDDNNDGDPSGAGINNDDDTNTINGINPNQSILFNDSKMDEAEKGENAIYDIMSNIQRAQLRAHVPFKKESFTTTKVTSTGKKVVVQSELPLTDAQLKFLYGFAMGKDVNGNVKINSNSNPSNTNNSNGASIESDDDDDAVNHYTDGVIGAMLDFVQNDVEHDRQLRNMLRPLVMHDIEEDIRLNKIDSNVFARLVEYAKKGANDTTTTTTTTTNTTANTNNSSPNTPNDTSQPLMGRDRFAMATQRAAITNNPPNANSADNSDDDIVEIDESLMPKEDSTTDDDYDDDDNEMGQFSPPQAAIHETPFSLTAMSALRDPLAPIHDDDVDDYDDLFSEDENDKKQHHQSNTTSQHQSTGPMSTASSLQKLLNGTHPSQQKPQLTSAEEEARKEKALHKQCVKVPKNSSNSEVLKLMMGKFTCPVCLGKVRKSLGTTKCGHMACYRCLCRSLALVKICPLCRTPLTSKDVFRLFG